MSLFENEPGGLMPVCPSCEKEYDPYDTHTCATNSIVPSTRRVTTEKAAACKADRAANPELYEPTALDVQPGGDHYRKLPIQPVEYIVANGIGFLPANIIKYASRYKDKGGAQDIRKIKHYCDLILEFEYKEAPNGR